MALSRESEDLLSALVERVNATAGATQGNVFRLERNQSAGRVLLNQPHIEDGETAWRLETRWELIEELRRADLFEIAPSGTRPDPDRWIIRAGIPSRALEWYREQQGR